MANTWGRPSRDGDTVAVNQFFRGWSITYDKEGNQLVAREYPTTQLQGRFSRTQRYATTLDPLSFRPMTAWQNSHFTTRYTSNRIERYKDGEYMDVLEVDRRFLTNPQRTTMMRLAGLNSTGRAELKNFPTGQAGTQALLKLGDRKMNLGEAILEARSSYSTAIGLTTKIVKIMRYARRGQWNRIRSNLGLKGNHTYVSKRFADNWLEYSYGILPLLNDATDAWSLYQEGLSRKPLMVSVERNISRSHLTTHDDATLICTVSSRRTTRCKLYARLSHDFVDNVQRLGLINPVELAWVSVPFSFMVDWILPIGSVLEASTARAGLVFVDGSMSAKSEWTSAFTIPLPKSSSRYTYGGNVSGLVSGSAYTRQKLYSFPRPTLWMASPFSLSRATSLLAILRQLT